LLYRLDTELKAEFYRNGPTLEPSRRPSDRRTPSETLSANRLWVDAKQATSYASLHTVSGFA